MLLQCSIPLNNTGALVDISGSLLARRCLKQCPARAMGLAEVNRAHAIALSVDGGSYMWSVTQKTNCWSAIKRDLRAYCTTTKTYMVLSHY